MTPIILLALLGVGMAAMMIGSGDSGSSDEPAEPSEEEELRRDDATIIGTAGDDVLDATAISALNQGGGAVSAKLEDGNDLFRDETTPDNAITFVDGGSGDDTLVGTPLAVQSFTGGEGNDSIILTDAGNADGGEGNDTIVYDMSDPQLDGGGNADGGEGDDILILTEILGRDNQYDPAGVAATGGEGADRFILEPTDGVKNPEEEFGNVGFDGEDRSVFLIEDFTPGEDELIVDLASFSEKGDLAFSNAELTQTDKHDYRLEEGEIGYELSLFFNSTDSDEVFTAVFEIIGRGPVSLSDIQLST